MTLTLKALAEEGYGLGLATIGEVECHIVLHYDAYWLISELHTREAELRNLVSGHEDDACQQYLAASDMKRIDDEMAAYFERAHAHDEDTSHGPF
jgi:hypothetical protein